MDHLRGDRQRSPITGKKHGYNFEIDAMSDDPVKAVPILAAGRFVHAEFKEALADKTAAFGKPVVLVHGDTHTFRTDKPLPGLPNFTRVETFGSPNVHWVRASVDARNPEVFSFRPEFVDENVTSWWGALLE